MEFWNENGIFGTKVELEIFGIYRTLDFFENIYGICGIKIEFFGTIFWPLHNPSLKHLSRFIVGDKF